MTSTKERQRAAARARLEREMAQRQAAARKRRQTQAIIGAGVALLLVVLGSIWLVSSLGDDDKADTAAEAPAATTCAYTNVPEEQRTSTIKDVGAPIVGQEPRTGTQVMTVTTNFGSFEVTMDLSKVPCTAASMSFLAGKKFFDGTKCHRMFPGMLQCGDPSAKGKGYRDSDGTGGPAYRMPEENLPVGQRPAYPAGTVAMAKAQDPASTGSQFFIVYTDQELDGPNYTVLGKITSGMETITKATAAGHDGAFDPSPGGGHPKKDIILQTVTVGAPTS